MRIEPRIREKTAARRAGVDVQIIRIECRTGRLKSLRWGRRGKFLIEPRDFDKWLEEWRKDPEKERLIPSPPTPSRRQKQRQQSPECIELQVQRDTQEKALKRFIADGDIEGAAVVERALATTVAEIKKHNG